MIISHKHKFIFIKTSKTAGTSIEVLLSRLCSSEDIVTPIYPAITGHIPRNYTGFFNPLIDIALLVKGENSKVKNKNLISSLLRRQKFYNHIPAVLVKNRVSKHVWDSYYKFCFDRNPFSRAVSHFNMLKGRGMVEQFSDFIYSDMTKNNIDYYTDLGGSLMVDKVYKYENLELELENIFDKLEIDIGEIELGKYKKGDDKIDYQSYYDEGTKKIVRNKFQKELDLHGYIF